MPTLLEDLVQESSASNQRVADRVAEETRSFDRLGQTQSSKENRAAIIQSARQAAERALSRVPEAEGFWNEALSELRQAPTGARAESLLRLLLSAFESSLRLVQSARELWQFALQAGAEPEPLQELKVAERRFEDLASEAKRALEHRARPWQPADPSRLAEGLLLAGEGKTIKADEARSRFRRTL